MMNLTLNSKTILQKSKKYFQDNWFSIIFIALITFTTIIPLVISLANIDFNKWEIDSKSNESLLNTLKFVGIDLIITVILIIFLILPLFAIGNRAHKWLSKISLAKSLVFSMGIQMVLSGMFYSVGSPFYDITTGIFGVDNFYGETRSMIPLCFQFFWNSAPMILIMLSTSISRYIVRNNEIINFMTFSGARLVLIDYFKGHWMEIALIVLMNVQGQWSFSPVLLFGIPENAIFNGQETLGLMIYKNITVGNYSEAATGSFVILMLSLTTILPIAYINWRISKVDVRYVVTKGDVSNPAPITKRWIQIISISAVCMLLMILVLPIVLMFVMSFVGVDYSNYMNQSFGIWTTENYNSLLSNAEFHKSMWLNFVLSFIPAIIAFITITFMIVFVNNKKTLTNTMTLNLFIFFAYLPSSSFLYGTFKMMLDLGLTNNPFAYFILPRVMYISKLMLLKETFTVKNGNAADIYNSMRISMYYRYKNEFIKNKELLIIILITSTINTDSYLFSSLGSTEDFTPFVVYLGTRLLDNNGEINTYEQQAALIWALFINILIYNFAKYLIMVIEPIKKSIEKRKNENK